MRPPARGLSRHRVRHRPARTMVAGNRSTSVPSMLYGRGDDCAVLTRLLTAAEGGTSAALVVRGEAGVGKTALVDWFHHEAAQRGRRGAPVRRASPRSPTSRSPGCTRSCGRRSTSMPALARLHQEALNGALGLSGRRGVDPFLVGVAALSLLGELAGDTALTCLVDDAQWLDPSTADVLRFVARRLDAEGVLMVFTVRDPDEATFEAPGLPEHRLRGLDDAGLVVAAPRPGADDLGRGQGAAGRAPRGQPAGDHRARATAERRASCRDSEALPDPLPMGGEVERLYAARAADLSPGRPAAAAPRGHRRHRRSRPGPRCQRGARDRRREAAGGRGERTDHGRARRGRVQAPAGALGDLPAVDLPGAAARARGHGRPARRRGECRPTGLAPRPGGHRTRRRAGRPARGLR